MPGITRLDGRIEQRGGRAVWVPSETRTTGCPVPKTTEEGWYILKHPCEPTYYRNPVAAMRPPTETGLDAAPAVV